MKGQTDELKDKETTSDKPKASAAQTLLAFTSYLVVF
jgi:hypothetical protein